jgi:hypothetical protein
MKKLFFLLLMTISSLTTYAQNSEIVHLRAHKLSVGIRETAGYPITWTVKNEPVNILIEAHQTKAIVYSAKTQMYYVINQEINTPTKKTWKCKNSEGLTCFLSIVSDPEYPGILAFEIAFDDMVWYYICTGE